MTDRDRESPLPQPKLFDEWLLRTWVLQRESYGADPSKLTGDERARYFAEMGFAAVVELGEMSNEIGWKSWGSDRGIDRPKYLKEAVDVLHFVANLLVLAGISDEELNTAYLAKMQTNRDRMLSGAYDGRVAGKCPTCRRSLDDVGAAAESDLCVECETAAGVS